MEFKLAEFVKDVERLTDEAIKQVKSPKYGTELIKGDRSCFFIYWSNGFCRKRT